MEYVTFEELEESDIECLRRDKETVSVMLKYLRNQARNNFLKFRSAKPEQLNELQWFVRAIERIHDELESYAYPKD